MLSAAKRAVMEMCRWGEVLFLVGAYPLLGVSRVRRRAFRLAREDLRHHIPIAPLAKIVNASLTDDDEITLRAVPERVHNCTIFELFTLAALTRTVSPSLCLEIGTYDGRSALAIAANCGPQTKVITLNLPPDYVKDHPEKSGVVDVQLSVKVQSGERWVGREGAGKIEQIFANSLEFDFTAVGEPQFVFIDGAHDRSTANSDTENALQIIDRKNGLVVWHDARDYGVRPVLRELHRRNYPVCIVEHTNMAVLRFRGGHPISLV
jgi:predicted O-methyltransferase YrrM